MSGERPPWTQNTAPDSVPFDPPDVLLALVPGAPIRAGDNALDSPSGEELLSGIPESSVMAKPDPPAPLLLLGIRFINAPFSFKISISTSNESSGIVTC